VFDWQRQKAMTVFMSTSLSCTQLGDSWFMSHPFTQWKLSGCAWKHFNAKD